MKRIGKTDQGGILLEMTADDLSRFQQAMEAVADLLVAGANHCIQINPEFIEPKTVPVKKAEKQAKKYVEEFKTSKTCVQCGNSFIPPRKDSRLCSKACTDKFYRAKHQTKSKTSGSDVCTVCGKPYNRKRKDQTCCSVACRRKITTRTKPEVVKPDAKVPARVVINEDVKKTRLETLRKLVKKDAYVPPEPRQSVGSGLEDISEFRQAQREASRE